MKKAYLAIGVKNRQFLLPEISAIESVLRKKEIHLFVFVDVYHFTGDQEREMMQTAFREIDSSDLLMAETSEKAIGVGIEIGYAVSRQKPVIYLRKATAEHSTTASGSAQYSIIYQNKEDLADQLEKLLSSSGF